jgi:hypothetical protein
MDRLRSGGWEIVHGRHGRTRKGEGEGVCCVGVGRGRMGVIGELLILLMAGR